MLRTLLILAAGIGGLIAVQHDEKNEPKRTVLLSKDIIEKLDGKEAKATYVEVAMEPGQSGSPHRHPGPVFGYVLEGVYEHAIDDQPAKTLKVGETFYEPTGCLHRVSKNPAAKGNTRILAVILHSRDSKQIAVPEPKK